MRLNMKLFPLLTLSDTPSNFAPVHCYRRTWEVRTSGKIPQSRAFLGFFFCIEPWIRQTGNHVILLSDLMSMCVRALALLQSVRSAQTPKMAPIDPCASTHAEAVQFGEGAACTFYLLSRMWIQIHAAQYTEMLCRFFIFFKPKMQLWKQYLLAWII